MVKRERENLRQLLRVTARLEERDLGSAVNAVRSAGAKEVVLPPGVRVEYGGLYASQQRAFLELVIVLAASAACVAAVLLVQFGSFAATIAIAVPSALALTGSLLALAITGTPLNVSSIVGMVMVIGIIAKNGILLVDFAQRAEAHATRAEALVQAGRVRLRPILMTSFAAAAGLLPLAFGVGAGGQMQQPLAIAILGGLSTSMMFSLFGVPIAFMALAREADVPA
jgi:multidrug efflux pump subunit AcrB